MRRSGLRSVAQPLTPPRNPFRSRPDFPHMPHFPINSRVPPPGRNFSSTGDPMNKSIFIALLIAGVVLIAWGIKASNSVSSDFSNFFTGSPTQKTLWLLAARLGGCGCRSLGNSMAHQVELAPGRMKHRTAGRFLSLFSAINFPLTDLPMSSASLHIKNIAVGSRIESNTGSWIGPTAHTGCSRENPCSFLKTSSPSLTIAVPPNRNTTKRWENNP